MRKHLTYANVIATLALFLALGGASYAAIKLPANSVGSRQIKNGAVSSVDIKNHSIKSGDFKGGLPSGPKGDRGPAAVKYWAQIGGGTSPAVTSSSGGVSVSLGSASSRDVTFPANVSKCAVELTQVDGPALVNFRVIERPTGSTVRVWASQPNGTGGVNTLTTGFDIAVFC